MSLFRYKKCYIEITNHKEAIQDGEVRVNLRKDRIPVTEVTNIKKEKRVFTGTNLYVKNYRLKKILLKLTMDESVRETKEIEYNALNKLTTIKLIGIEKYLDLLTRKEFVLNKYRHSLNLNIFESEFTKKQFLNNLHFNTKFLKKRIILGCYMQKVTRTVQERYEFEEAFSPSTSTDSENNKEENEKKSTTSGKTKTKKDAQSPKYQEFFKHNKFDLAQNKIRLP